ncbi:MAG: hypothetical protein GX675_04160 [Erysipelotrichaceae bacterium]|nr:hypothetical protein [Erysipelotrichaceae bacterium]
MFWKYFIGSMLIIGFTYLVYVFLYRQKFVKLSEMLYVNADAEAYLKELNKFSTSIFFQKKLVEMMKIDAYMMLGEDDKLESLFDYLSKTKLRAGDEFVVAQKKIGYYSIKKDIVKIKETYARMQELRNIIKAKSYETYDNALVEVEYMVALLEKDGKFAKDLANKGNQAGETLIGGTYYYKAAQSYYYQNDEKNAKYFLEKALHLLKGTNYEKKIKEILDSNNLKGLDD